MAERALPATLHRGMIFLLTEECNSRCVMCDSWRVPEPRSLDAEEVMSFWRRRVRTRKGSVALTGGEPLLYPRLFELMEVFRANTDHLVLSTNGLLLGRHAPEVARYCSKVIVSVDGATGGTFRAVRGISALDQVIDGARIVRRLSARTRVLFKMTVQRRNFREVPEVFRLAQEVGASGLALTVPDVDTSSFLKLEGERADRSRTILLTESECEEFRGIAEETARRFATPLAAGYVVEGSLDGCLAFFEYRAGVGRPPAPRTCERALTRIVVMPDGSLRPCFFLPPFGTIRDPGGGDIFDDPAVSGFRERFDSRQEPACRECRQFVDWRF
ncbi:MAG: radical SAM protein [Bryobacteraceae bacterium]